MKLSRREIVTFGIGVVVAGALIGGGIAIFVDGKDTPDAAAVPTTQAILRAPTTTAVTSTTPPTTTSSTSPRPTTTTSTARSEYPKFVPKSQVDHRYSQWVEGDRMVMLAPGVYAEAPPDGVLGTLDDYSAYLGNCTAIKRYSELHPGGSTCWG